MEGDDKKAEAKMVGTSATGYIDESIFPPSPFESSFFNELHINEEPSQTETAATSSPNLTIRKIKEEEPSSGTPTKRKRGRPLGPGSGSKKEGLSPTISAESPTKRTPDSPSATGGAKFTPHVIHFNAGEDVVEVLYKISVANRGKTVTVLSANGSISEIVYLTPNGLWQSKGEFHLLSLKWPDDDNGRRSREKTVCTITGTSAEGNLFANTSVNSLIAAGHVKITAGLFNTDTAEKTGARISAAALQMFEANMDPAKEGSTSGYLPTTPIVGDGSIISPTSATTSASNDQDMKSPSVGNT
ncbi:AT-hook motif nuclear-localized protein 10-like [Vicia villosa]|uniref:AT-hook motif nuclear-localized protein 10-like n=1 Tax=Vicia villosa TaxID=3911 RepID=UPI00273B29F4|nr:AT-hook motif nuclear-localized protein 10-like [Vicia villosa]